MRRFGSVGWAFTILALAIVVAGGCESDGPSELLCLEEPQQPIARLKFLFGGAVTTDSLGFVYFTVDYPEEPKRPVLCSIKISDGDSSRVVELGSSTSDSFDEFMILLTNGHENSIGMTFSSGSNLGWSIGGPHPESRVLYDVSEYTGAPDLMRQTIERVTLAVTRASMKFPGRDPNGDGRWMEFWVTVEIRFWGIEE